MFPNGTRYTLVASTIRKCAFAELFQSGQSDAIGKWFSAEIVKVFFFFIIYSQAWNSVPQKHAPSIRARLGTTVRVGAV
jgi:hypothetical protein